MMNRATFLRRMASAVVGVGMLGSELLGRQTAPNGPIFVQTNQIASSTITYATISVDRLSAISADAELYSYGPVGYIA